MYGEVIKFREQKTKSRKRRVILHWVVLALFAPVVIWAIVAEVWRQVVRWVESVSRALAEWLGGVCLEMLDEVFLIIRRANKLNNQHFADELEAKPENWVILPDLEVNAHINTQLTQLLETLCRMSDVQVKSLPSTRLDFETVIMKLFHCVRRHSPNKSGKLLSLMVKLAWVKYKLSNELSKSERVLAAFHTAQTLRLSTYQDAYARSEVTKTAQEFQKALLAYWRFVESPQALHIDHFNDLTDSVDQLKEQLHFCSQLIAGQAGPEYFVKDSKVVRKDDVLLQPQHTKTVLEAEALPFEIFTEAPKPDYVFVIEGNGTEEKAPDVRTGDLRQAKLSFKALEELKARQTFIPQQPIVHICYDQDKAAPVQPPKRTVVKPMSCVPAMQVRSLLEEMQAMKKRPSEATVFGD